MKTERDVIERLGPPDEIVRPEDRIRNRCWLCSRCGTVTTAAEPVSIPAPCTKVRRYIVRDGGEPTSVAPPKFVRPCIPTTAKVIPLGEAWLHEPKLDGYRFQIVKDGLAPRLYEPDRLRLNEAPSRASQRSRA